MPPATTTVPRPRLPTLDDGIHVLSIDSDDVGPLHALAIDHVLGANARPSTPAYWVDPGHTAQTYSLSELAPSPRVLDRFQVARGFTAHQHHDIVRQAARRADGETPLLVAPAVDTRYRAADCPAGIAEQLFGGTVDALDRTARQYGTTVVVTTGEENPLAEPLTEVAERVLKVEQTALGPRFVDDGVETLVYPIESRPDGDVYQTTLSYWRQVIEHRVAHEATPAGQDPSPVDGRATES